ncbi:MAG: VWA domain-containing protein, partial [Calditrichaeota bacterium]
MMELAPTIRLDTPGLETADAVSLQSLFYRGTIEGPLGRFMLQQHFQNQTEKPLEIVYTFPLNSNMLITGFLLKVNGQTLHSEVKKLEDAQEDYEKAIFEGNTAAYLQHHRKNIFSMNIGNLDAGEDLLVQMNLLQLLAVHGKQMRILLPTVVGPRYIPGEAAGERTGFGWGRPTRQVPDADWITPPVSESGVPYRISFQIEITDNQNISVIDSPSHKIRVRRSVDTTIVESVSDDRANRDIVLNLEFDQYPTNKAWIGQSNSTSLMLYWANHQPENVPPRAPADYLFLVDKSGSMADEKLEIVKRALRLCLRKLCPGDGFNLIAFDNHYFAWQSRFYEIREESMSDADLWIQKLRASGGTEILDALRFGLSIPADSKRQKVLVLLTDGQVGNEAEIEALLDKANEQLKVLLFGIDTAVNQELFERIIAKVPGFVEYIYPGEPLEAKVNLQFERLFLPILESIQVADNGLEIESILPEQPQSLHPQDAIPYLMSFKGKVPESLLFRYKLNEGDPV